MSLSINNHNVHHVLVHVGSAVNILYYSAFSRMNLSIKQLEQYGSLIQDFNGKSVSLEGTSRLIVKASAHPLCTTEMSFLVVKLPTPYNTILRCYGLCALDAMLFPNY